MAFYDGNKLLNLKDLDKKQPEIFLCSGNRTGGKTTYFGKYLLDCYFKKGMRFGLQVRNVKELDDIAEQFFKDITGLFYPNISWGQKRSSFGQYLIINDEVAGYAWALKHAKEIKKKSHLLSDCAHYLMDEFQGGPYLKTEISDFISIHTSIARGQGKQVRYVPVYMLSNKLSLLNPYFVALGISARLKKDTKFLRGHGWVMEQNYNESAYLAQQESAFIQAFSDVEDGAQMVYLEDNENFIERPKTPGRYLCTLVCDDLSIGLTEHHVEGIVYASKRFDPSFPLKFTASVTQHSANKILINRSFALYEDLRKYFEMGLFRFSDAQTKGAILQLLSY